MSLFTFQHHAWKWCLDCFGLSVCQDRTERSYRVLEEALEVAQAGGADRAEAHRLVDYVFSRPIGDAAQEMGGLMVTAAVLAEGLGLDLEKCARDELERCVRNIDRIRAKGLAKRVGIGSSIAGDNG